MLISNTSTLILLAKVTSLSAFLDEIKEIAIPKIVYHELTTKEDSFDVLLIKKEFEKKRILVFDVDRGSYAPIMKQFKMDEGEAAAYSLFKQKKGHCILTDDSELIKLCKIEGVPFTCSMAAIVRLCKKGKLTREDALEKIDGLYKHGWYSNEIYNYFKEKVI